MTAACSNNTIYQFIAAFVLFGKKVLHHSSKDGYLKREMINPDSLGIHAQGYVFANCEILCSGDISSQLVLTNPPEDSL